MSDGLLIKHIPKTSFLQHQIENGKYTFNKS